MGRIVAALEHLDGDVLVLSEHRASGPLGSLLAEAGWVHQAGTPDPVGGYAAVLIASRRPLIQVGPAYHDPDDGLRLDHAFLSPGRPLPLAVDYPSEINGEPTTRAGSRKADGERPPLSDHVPIVVDLPA